MATSKRILRVELTPKLKAQIRRLQKKQRKHIGAVITAVRDGFGSPHLHSGLGIRRLRDTIFECRVDLRLRLVFYLEAGTISFTDLGTHGEIRNLLKSL